MVKAQAQQKEIDYAIMLAEQVNAGQMSARDMVWILKGRTPR